MTRAKHKGSGILIERMLDEASWLLSHAQALADYGRREESLAELARAAACEEKVACLLEADSQEREAAIHRVSAASCQERLGQYARAVTLLRAALSADLPNEFRARATEQRTRCLALAQKEVHKASTTGSRKQVPAVS